MPSIFSARATKLRWTICSTRYHIVPLTGFLPVNKQEGQTMSKRSSMSGKHSRKLFTRTAQRVHPKNLIGKPMRGGIRL